MPVGQTQFCSTLMIPFLHAIFTVAFAAYSSISRYDLLPTHGRPPHPLIMNATHPPSPPPHVRHPSSFFKAYIQMSIETGSTHAA